MKKVTFAQDKRITTPQGHVALFKRGVPREVTNVVYEEAIKQGGVPGAVKMEFEDNSEDGNGDTEPNSGEVNVGTPATKPPIEMLAETVRDIIDSGDSDKLIASSGKVRVDALNNELNREDITAEDRDAAHALIESGE